MLITNALPTISTLMGPPACSSASFRTTWTSSVALGRSETVRTVDGMFDEWLIDSSEAVFKENKIFLTTWIDVAVICARTRSRLSGICFQV